MPQKTLLGVTRDEWLALVYWGGLSAYCTGYANHDEHTVYVSLIGRVTAVKAVWAAFMDHQALPLSLDRPPPVPAPQVHRPGTGQAGQADEASLWRLPTDEETKYHTLSVRLPDTDWGHTVMVHSQATQSNLADRLFHVLSGRAEPPLRRFWAQWNRCLPYPSQPEWAAYLWGQGIHHQLITPCQSQGTYAWAIRPGETWADIIAGGIQDGEIGP
jgi:hypothetical protein